MDRAAVKRVLNDHEKLCEEYRKLDDDVREIKDHLESFVQNLASSVVNNSNQMRSSHPNPNTKDIARILKTPKNPCYFCSRPHHVHMDCRSASQAATNNIRANG